MSNGDGTTSLNGVMTGYSAGTAKIESVCCISIDGETHNSANLCFDVNSYLQAKARTNNSLSLFPHPFLANILDLGLEQMTSPRPSSTKAVLFENKRKEIAYPRGRMSFIGTFLHARKSLNDTSNEVRGRCALGELYNNNSFRIAHRRILYYEFLDK